mmetsp:Transcript_31935/g.5789  ORF Transcript_31935/g.5789 Transcript_31935/m.5789 type:complete len:82 (+) Transcript_31935:200-445(+)
MRVITAIELNHLKIARKIAFDVEFINSNKMFVTSGEPIKAAIENGHIEFARELISIGYTVSSNMLVKAIRDKSEKLINNTL